VGCATDPRIAPLSGADVGEVARLDLAAVRKARELVGADLVEPQYSQLSKQSGATSGAVMGGLLGALLGLKSTASGAALGSATQERLPEFPSSPPEPSALLADLDLLLPISLRGQDQARVGGILCSAMVLKGYGSPRFLAFAGGFAALTLPERFQEDGSSWPSNSRFLKDANPVPWWNIAEVARRLILPAEVMWRMFVFTVTEHDELRLSPLAKALPALSLSAAGGLGPPSSSARRVVRRVDVLVYEFEKRSDTESAVLRPGRLDALKHLRGSGLEEAIRSRMGSAAAAG
jgi:hypothetical protein